MASHIGVDVGGTFICVAVGDSGHVYHAKSFTTKTNVTAGILRGLADLSRAMHVSVRELLGAAEHFSHGTTIGTNLIVERKGARVGLICTRGHRDAILMMRGAGRTAGKPAEHVYQPHDSRTPPPIVARRSILEINERIDRNGDVVVGLKPSTRSPIETRSVGSVHARRRAVAMRSCERAVLPELTVSACAPLASRSASASRIARLSMSRLTATWNTPRMHL